ncbi:hypothetical protein [Treponema phagedenis]|nr:hypothetical protein [Treponema phagedenis]
MTKSEQIQNSQTDLIKNTKNQGVAVVPRRIEFENYHSVLGV